MVEVASLVGSGRSVADVVAGLDVGRDVTKPIPSGFEPLDAVLDGGFPTRELALLGGPPGVGKTSVALQWARHAAKTGHTVVFACYEHDEVTLLGRLLAQEIGEIAGDQPLASHETRLAVRAVTHGEALREEHLSGNPVIRAAYSRLNAFADRLWLIRASGVDTGLPQLVEIADTYGPGTLLFIDYLQKIAGDGDTLGDHDRVIRQAAGLKDLALGREIAVVAIVAGDESGLSTRRMRVRHLRGSAGLAYEADIVLMMNEKALAVSKAHSAFDPVRARKFNNQVVLSLDKNRDGPGSIDMEFTKDLAHFRLAPDGAVVDDRLVDDLLYRE